MFLKLHKSVISVTELLHRYSMAEINFLNIKQIKSVSKSCSERMKSGTSASDSEIGVIFRLEEWGNPPTSQSKQLHRSYFYCK